jgi:hypothetical protein
MKRCGARSRPAVNCSAKCDPSQSAQGKLAGKLTIFGVNWTIKGMPTRQPRLKRFSSPDNREGLPLHELLQLSESGRLAIKACYEIRAARDNKPLIWDDRGDWEQIDDTRLRYFNGRAAEVT